MYFAYTDLNWFLLLFIVLVFVDLLLILGIALLCCLIVGFGFELVLIAIRELLCLFCDYGFGVFVLVVLIFCFDTWGWVLCVLFGCEYVEVFDVLDLGVVFLRWVCFGVTFLDGML